MPRYRTPLRYPGGKQRLAPFIREVLRQNSAAGWNYVEPYAGGAGVAMELLLANEVGDIYLNDSSVHIYSFWSAILEEPDEFCRKISAVTLDIKHWREHREVVRSPGQFSKFQIGFSTFILNRCNRSGVIRGGVIGGLDQKGNWKLDARFPRKELIKRVENIAEMKDRVKLSNLDAQEFLSSVVAKLPKSTLVYLDPPYYERADRLYLNSYKKADHEHLAAFVQEQLAHPWLVSYDGSPDIARFYSQRKQFQYTLQYSANHAHLGIEIFIFSDSLELPRASVLPSVSRALREFHESGRPQHLACTTI